MGWGGVASIVEEKKDEGEGVTYSSALPCICSLAICPSDLVESGCSFRATIQVSNVQSNQGRVG
jgi:hypothetical protein